MKSNVRLCELTTLAWCRRYYRTVYGWFTFDFCVNRLYSHTDAHTGCTHTIKGSCHSATLFVLVQISTSVVMYALLFEFWLLVAHVDRWTNTFATKCQNSKSSASTTTLVQICTNTNKVAKWQLLLRVCIQPVWASVCERWDLLS